MSVGFPEPQKVTPCEAFPIPSSGSLAPARRRQAPLARRTSLPDWPILRETLAFHSPLADFAFAMQGLGSGAITLAGSPAQQAHYLQGVARGELIAAFALSEPEAGSDVGAM